MRPSDRAATPRERRSPRRPPRGVRHDHHAAGRQPVLADQRARRLRDGDDRVRPLQQPALRPPGQVVEPPERPHRGRQVARRRAVAVVDQVVDREHEAVAAAERAHRLHRREHDVRLQPVDQQSDERLERTGRARHLLPRQGRQHRELPAVADQHRDVVQPRQFAHDLGRVSADAVVASGAACTGSPRRSSSVDPFVERAAQHGGRLVRSLVVDQVAHSVDHVQPSVRQCLEEPVLRGSGVMSSCAAAISCVGTRCPARTRSRRARPRRGTPPAPCRARRRR